MKTRKLLWIILAIIVVGIGAYYGVSLSKKGTNADIEQSQALDIAFNKQGNLYFIDSEKNDTISVIDIEIADTEQKRAQGLMYRKSIPENAGMLFILDEEEMQSFWMKNTYISLDMLFVNANKEIVTICPNTTPLKEWSYASTKPALYVVEVNAGYCAKKGITEGDKINFSN